MEIVLVEWDDAHMEGWWIDGVPEAPTPTLVQSVGWLANVHHSAVKEFPGVTCESFRTLAAQDAYAAGHGYRAGRDMRCIVHHREYGEIERHRCDVAMLEAA